MTDGVSRTYADLLEGEYDCLDSIVLNTFAFRAARQTFTLCDSSCTVGGRLRTWAAAR